MVSSRGVQLFKSKMTSIAACYMFLSSTPSNTSNRPRSSTTSTSTNAERNTGSHTSIQMAVDSFSFPLHFIATANNPHRHHNFHHHEDHSSTSSTSCSRGGFRTRSSEIRQDYTQTVFATSSIHSCDNDAENKLVGTAAAAEVQVTTTGEKSTMYQGIQKEGKDNHVKEGRRSYETKADFYFRKHGMIPKPNVIHENIIQLMKQDSRRNGDSTHTSSDKSTSMSVTNTDTKMEESKNNGNILIIGDVHGCLNELKMIVDKAQKRYHDQPFKCVILVGDLCNKGPNSAEVIKYVRNQQHWYTVRGNHDDGALAAALGDPKRCREEKYAWVYGVHGRKESGVGNNEKGSLSSLSDEDVEWLSNIPYTITIPKSFLRGNNNHNEHDDTKSQYQDDVLIVHAGFIPNIPLESQDIKTMVTVRDIVQTTDTHEKADDISSSSRSKNYEYYEHKKHNHLDPHQIKPWAKEWKGPQLVVFGHDAKRGLQMEEFAIGLDTGCTYGKELSAVVLPSGEVISVKAEKVHCPIIEK